MNGQPQEPPLKGEGESYIIWATRRGKFGTERRYIMAPDGSLLHTDAASIYPILSTLIKAGWGKGVADSLAQKGDHWVSRGTMTMTPPDRGAKGSRAGVSVPAVDPSRSTPDAVKTAVATVHPETPT